MIKWNRLRRQDWLRILQRKSNLYIHASKSECNELNASKNLPPIGESCLIQNAIAWPRPCLLLVLSVVWIHSSIMELCYLGARMSPAPFQYRHRYNRIIWCLYTCMNDADASPIHIVCYFVFVTMRFFHVPPFIIKPSLCLWNASSAEHNMPNKMN